MVSFSCDECQDVFTRARVDRHFGSCRTWSVSCIDCGVTFDARSVRAHTSCISEADKYAGGSQRARARGGSFCDACGVAVAGGAAAEIHYASRKHRAQVRRRAAEEKARGRREAAGEAPPPAPAALPATAAPDAQAARRGVGKTQLKSVMKKVLKKAPKRRLRERKLVKAILSTLGESAPDNVAGEVERIAGKSRRFSVGKYVTLISK